LIALKVEDKHVHIQDVVVHCHYCRSDAKMSFNRSNEKLSKFWIDHNYDMSKETLVKFSKTDVRRSVAGSQC